MFFPYKIEDISYWPSLLNWFVLGLSTIIFASTYSSFQLLNEVQGIPVLEQFVRSFYHNDPFHFAGNMFYLYFFGNLVSRLLGNKIYVSVTLVIILLSYFIDHELETETIGISTIIYGFLGLSVVTHPLLKFKFLYIFGYGNGVFKLSLIWVAILMTLFSDLEGAIYQLTDSNYGGSIAYSHHLIGFLAGFFIAHVGLRDKLFKKQDTHITLHSVYEKPSLLSFNFIKNKSNKHIVNCFVLYMIFSSVLSVVGIMVFVKNGSHSNLSNWIPLSYYILNIFAALLVYFRKTFVHSMLAILIVFNVVMYFVSGWAILYYLTNIITLIMLMQAKVHKIYWPWFGAQSRLSRMKMSNNRGQTTF